MIHTLKTNKAHTLLQAIKKHKLIQIVDHGIKSQEELVDFSTNLGDLLAWDFGFVNELRYTPHALNYLYSDEAVPFHWDGAFASVPYLLIFHCIKAPPPGAGGETLFVDGQSILKRISATRYEQLKNLNITYITEKKAHYGGEFSSKCIVNHPFTGHPTLRYAEPVTTKKNPVSMTIAEVDSRTCFEIQTCMRHMLYHPDNCYIHTWQDNQLIIADNHALLHARFSFHQNAPRFIRRVQVLTPRGCHA